METYFIRNDSFCFNLTDLDAITHWQPAPFGAAKMWLHRQVWPVLKINVLQLLSAKMGGR